MPPTLKKIQAGILHNNFDQIYEGIHYLKSSLDFLGTEKVLEHRKIIEKASKQKDIETIKKEYNHFEKGTIDLIRMYQTHLDLHS